MYPVVFNRINEIKTNVTTVSNIVDRHFDKDHDVIGYRARRKRLRYLTAYVT